MKSEAIVALNFIVFLLAAVGTAFFHGNEGFPVWLLLSAATTVAAIVTLERDSG